MNLFSGGVLLAAMFAAGLSSAEAAPGVTRAKPAVIQLLSPQGKRVVTAAATPFRWTRLAPAVDARTYEVQLFRYEGSSSKPQGLAQGSVSGANSSLPELGGILPIGAYAWRVIAKNSRGEVIGQGQTRFKIVSEIRRKKGQLAVLAGVDLAPLSYTSKTNAYEATIPTTLSGASGRIEYFISENWKALLSAQVLVLKFDQKNLSFSEYGLGAVRSFALDDAEDLRMGAGIQLKSISSPDISSSDGFTFQTGTVQRITASPLVRVEYHLAENFYFHSQFEVGKTLSLSSANSAGITQNKTKLSTRTTLGLTGTWYKPWELSLESSYVRDGFIYTTATNEVATSYGGYDLQLAVIYVF